MNPTTTLAKIRACHPCAEGWSKLLAGLGYADGNYDPDRVVSLGDIATTNGAADAFWAIRALDWSDVAVRRAVIAGAVLPAIQRVCAHEAVADLAKWCAGDDSVDLRSVADATYAAALAADAALAALAADAADAAALAADADAERKQQFADILANFACVALK